MKTLSRLRPLIHWLTDAHRDAAALIDARSFAHPMAAQDIREAANVQNVIAQVATVDAGYYSPQTCVVGYMVYRLRKRSIELLRLAVDPSARRRGVGRAMVDKLRSKLSPGGTRCVMADVPDDWLDAHLFLKATGWKAVDVIALRGGDDYRFVLR